MLLGFIFFAAIVTGLILNTSFLVREIRKNEQHDSFINAVTHELKTPIASIRLYLQTLQRREVEETQRRDFYRLMIEDTDRLSNTVEQVLKAGRAGARKAEHVEVDFAGLVERLRGDERETSYHLQAGSFAVRIFAERARVGSDRRSRRPADGGIESAGQCGQVLGESRGYFRAPGFGGTESGWCCECRTAGVGIPRGELKSIFKRFYRVPGRALPQVRGTGLGLFLVRTIAQTARGAGHSGERGRGQGRDRDSGDSRGGPREPGFDCGGRGAHRQRAAVQFAG